MTDDDGAADSGMPHAAAEVDVVFESREAVGFVIGIRVGEARVRLGRSCGARRGCRRGASGRGATHDVGS
jgi:hypothetical protein